MILDSTSELFARIQDRRALIGILGLGYVGLPLAKAFLDAGFRVLGYDVDDAKVAKLNRGESYIGHIAASLIAQWVRDDSFEATANSARLSEPDALLICVPTPLTDSRDPDLQYVESTVKQIAAHLRCGQLIVLESTTYPGTTRDVVLPLLAVSELKVGEDFFLAYSPEREDPGNKHYSTARIPKVVGGFNPASQRIASALYKAVVTEVVPVSSCEVAESCKILENAYRAVNIALVNELKVLCEKMQIDVWEVIDAARSKPFGFQPFYPGPGLGGHCIPIDPFYLSWVARKHGLPTRFIELAGEINSAMPDYVLKRVSAALNNVQKPVRGSRILVLGAAYKKDVDDPRESPSFVLMEGLINQGALVNYNDPYLPTLPRMRNHELPPLKSVELTGDALRSQDLVLIATDHSVYDYDFIVGQSALIVDTRNATRNVAIGREKITKA